MLLKKLTREELDFIQYLHDPIILSEVLFSPKVENLESLKFFEEEEFFKVRLYQLPMFSYEYLIANNDELTDEENFKLKKKAGSRYIYCGRKIGKTLVQLIDLLIDTIHNIVDWVTAFSSFDESHVAGIIEPYITIMQNHDFFKIFKLQVQRKHNRYTVGGHTLEAVNMNLASKRAGCFDKETELLTNNGWRKWNTVKKTDKVLSVNLETSEADYYDIKNIFIYDWNDKIIKVKNQTLDIAVTPEHSMIYYNKYKRNWKKSLMNKANYINFIPSSFNYKGKSQQVISFKFREGSNNKNWVEKEIPMKVWVKFLGWYISEGCLSSLKMKKQKNYIVNISQSFEKNKTNCKEIINILEDMGLNHWISNNMTISFKNKEIYLHLEKYIKRHSHCKRIPNYIFNLSKELKEQFLDSYLKGDGYINKGQQRFYTVNKDLADDLQILLLHCGYNSSIGTKPSGYGDFVYVVNKLKNKKKCFYRSQQENIKYIGKVWDLEVEPYHTLVARRNGKVYITGNSNWERIHAQKQVIDEHQYETDKVAHKRSQSTSEGGCIERFSGITSFKKHTPAGRIFDELSLKNWLINLPQLISPKWGEDAKKKALKDYGGEETIGYKTHILAEVCENAIGIYDIDRVRKCYNNKKRIKHFEISQENFNRFHDLIIIEKPNNAERTWIALDFGETAPTEIIVLFEVAGKYKYTYNITLYRLVPDEQFEIVKYIAELLEANFIGLDCTEEGGRQIYRDLAQIYPKENLIWVGFNEKIKVDFEKDEQGNVIMKEGKPIWQKESTMDWSIRQLKTLLYTEKIEIPTNHKFDKQFNGMISSEGKPGSGRITYGTTAGEDHLHASFQVFGIMEWEKVKLHIKSIKKKTWGTGKFKRI